MKPPKEPNRKPLYPTFVWKTLTTYPKLLRGILDISTRDIFYADILEILQTGWRRVPPVKRHLIFSGWRQPKRLTIYIGMYRRWSVKWQNLWSLEKESKRSDEGAPYPILSERPSAHRAPSHYVKYPTRPYHAPFPNCFRFLISDFKITFSSSPPSTAICLPWILRIPYT